MDFINTINYEQEYKKAYEESLSLWPVKYKDYFVSTTYGLTYVIESGDLNAEPLLLLHGASMSSTMWFPNIEELCKQYRVLSVDILGDKNKSLPTNEFLDRRSHAKWLEEVLDGLNITRANFIGLSYGALNVMNLLNYSPDRVNKVVLISPAATFVPLSPDFYSYAFKMVKSTSGVDNFLEWIFGDRYELPHQLKKQLYAGMMWVDPNKGTKPKASGFPYVFNNLELSEMKNPILLLFGEHEVMYDPKEALARAIDYVPNIRAEIIKGVGHLMTLEDPRTTTFYALEFLSS
ncbi:alpha/beta fold hydrolase [Metabacillus halosaccharovorans]|uniref:alpha/beta fold hydrolase n=1 Tax=Metabacillus halosaccharovorans TaxID=930124 RepID=UPI00204265F6|nr:alpha/beta hydrolase [Metabacillus halosaccharovorans]MCM3442929.1 alpha/beta hydrolase [Metabacillus halosaccharovorans]